MSDFLTEQEHLDGHIHRIGGALLLPVQTQPSPVGINVAASNGILETIAREDHIHQFGALGELHLYAVNTSLISAGWLKADGSAISRTTYALLFALIGTTYGAGDGVTTFNIPNAGTGPGGTFYYIKALNV